MIKIRLYFDQNFLHRRICNHKDKPEILRIFIAIFIISGIFWESLHCRTRYDFYWNSFRPTFAVSSATEQLAFDTDSETLQFLKENNITVTEGKIDCKGSLEAISNMKTEHSLWTLSTPRCFCPSRGDFFSLTPPVDLIPLLRKTKFSKIMKC